MAGTTWDMLNTEGQQGPAGDRPRRGLGPGGALGGSAQAGGPASLGHTGLVTGCQLLAGAAGWEGRMFFQRLLQLQPDHSPGSMESAILSVCVQLGQRALGAKASGPGLPRAGLSAPGRHTPPLPRSPPPPSHAAAREQGVGDLAEKAGGRGDLCVPGGGRTPWPGPQVHSPRPCQSCRSAGFKPGTRSEAAVQVRGQV